ncbi:MAG: recombinase family protein [Sterolibacterium sp.]
MNAIIYARFSPRPGAELCESIELQMERCRAYIGMKGYNELWIYEDRELSGGRADNRPGLQAALDTACQRKAVLVCYSLSRLARNTRDALAIIDRLEKHGANLALLDLNLDTASPMGRCMFTIMSAIAELERQQIAQRTSDAMQRHQANGRRMSRHAPYGFHAGRNGVLVPSQYEQAAIQKIHELASRDMGPRAIARELERLDIRCRMRKAWHHGTVARILGRATPVPKASDGHDHVRAKEHQAGKITADAVVNQPENVSGNPQPEA